MPQANNTAYVRERYARDEEFRNRRNEARTRYARRKREDPEKHAEMKLTMRAYMARYRAAKAAARAAAAPATPPATDLTRAGVRPLMGPV